MMGWLLGKLGYAKRSGTSRPAQWLIDCFTGGTGSSAGVNVTEKSALQYTPFWAAVRIISGTVGALPFKVYRRIEGGKTPVPEHPVHALLHERPNPYMDAVTFLETRQGHVLTHGNGYAEIQRDGRGRPVALWPLLPDRTHRKIKDGVPYYEVQVQTGETVPLPDEAVLHVKGLGFDGYTGYPVVRYHKEAIGYGVAVKQYGARFFANDGNPGGVLEHPGKLDEKAFDHLKKSWAANQTGLSNAHRMQILEEDMKWKPIGVEPAKAQAMDVQKYTVDDCARIFQIPPHMIGSMQFSKYANVEQLQIEFIARTMLYWFRKWEQEVNYKLLMPRERGTYFCEILVDALLRGNVEARGQFYALGRQWGFLSVNDIRGFENLNPIGPAGDIYLEPLNMKPAGTPGPDEPAAPDAGADPPTQDDDVRDAHHALIASAWRRVITKQDNALARGVGVDFWNRLRTFSFSVLGGPVRAYAAVLGVRPLDAEAITQTFIDIAIQEAAPPVADADGLAEALINEIGDDHASDD
jgi:HK97 family phage portal protein